MDFKSLCGQLLSFFGDKTFFALGDKTGIKSQIEGKKGDRWSEAPDVPG